MRRFGPNENIAPFGADGPTTVQIAFYRLTHVDGDRQPLIAVSLAPQYHLTNTPIDIV